MNEQEKQPIVNDVECVSNPINENDVKETQESGLEIHAREELKLAGMFDKNSDYGGMIGNAVMELIKVFAEQDHSGYSASMVRNIFNKLADFKTICPLTGEDSEWNDVGGPTIGDKVFQNNRNSAVFKDGKNGQAYYIDAIIWRTQKGMTYTGTTEEGITSRQFIKSFPFTPKTFYIDVIEEEVKKDDWIFRIKNMADLDEVWKVYDRMVFKKED